MYGVGVIISKQLFKKQNNKKKTRDKLEPQRHQLFSSLCPLPKCLFHPPALENCYSSFSARVHATSPRKPPLPKFFRKSKALLSPVLTDELVTLPGKDA